MTAMTKADAKLLSTRGVGKGLAREVVRAFRGLQKVPCALAECPNQLLIVKGEKGQWGCSKKCIAGCEEKQAQRKAGGAKGR
eukprot:gene11798-19255_t